MACSAVVHSICMRGMLAMVKRFMSSYAGDAVASLVGGDRPIYDAMTARAHRSAIYGGDFRSRSDERHQARRGGVNKSRADGL